MYPFSREEGHPARREISRRFDRDTATFATRGEGRPIEKVCTADPTCLWPKAEDPRGWGTESPRSDRVLLPRFFTRDLIGVAEEDSMVLAAGGAGLVGIDRVLRCEGERNED